MHIQVALCHKFLCVSKDITGALNFELLKSYCCFIKRKIMYKIENLKYII